MGLKKANKDVVKDDLGFNEAVNQIEEESYRNIDNDSPVVSEDGFIHDVPMLYGFYDENTGILHNTFTYREMDGRDEEAINKNDVKSNGAKVSNILVERCVSEIGTFKKSEMGTKEWGAFVRNLAGGDIDFMCLKIREISKGSTVTFTQVCPRCGSKMITEMECNEFQTKKFEGETPYIPFNLPRGYKDKLNKIHKKGTIRLANGFDREVVAPLMAKNKAVAITKLLLRTMNLDDDTPVSEDCIRCMSVRDRDYLEKVIEEKGFGVDMSFEGIKCSCGMDLSDVRGQSDFF